MAELYEGLVIGNNGAVYYYKPDNKAKYGFYLIQDDQSWDGGHGCGTDSWEPLKLSHIQNMDRDDMSIVDDLLGNSFACETYQETADRLRKEGNDHLADIYEAMEKRWFELSN